jgi:hypothetical protein
MGVFPTQVEMLYLEIDDFPAVHRSQIVALIYRNIYRERQRGMWEGWTCKKDATYQRYEPKAIGEGESMAAGDGESMACCWRSAMESR